MSNATVTAPLGQGHPTPAFAAWAEKRAEKRALGLLPPLPEPKELIRVPDPDAFVRVGDLVAEPDNPHPWIVHGLVPAGGMTLIAGKPKAGKSTLARAIALRVARGEPVLGRATMQGPVLYLGLEDPRAAIKGHFSRMGVGMADDLHVYMGKVPEHAQLWLQEQCTQRDPVLVVIDTMQFFLGIAEINEYGAVVNQLRTILDVFRPTRCGVVIVHHAGKGDRSGFDAVLGSTGIMGTVDVGILVKRRPDDQTRTIATMQRMHAPGGQDMEETVLTLDDHTEPTLAGTLMDYELDKMGDTIRDYLATQADWVEGKTVKDAVEGRVQTKVKALDSLFRSGKVERQGEGKKGSPYLFRIPVFRSPHTPGTAEQNLKTPETPGEDRPIAVPTISAPVEIPSKNGNGICAKGHPTVLGVCPECDSQTFLAMLEAEATAYRATL